jgi:hypothetical protein
LLVARLLLKQPCDGERHLPCERGPAQTAPLGSKSESVALVISKPDAMHAATVDLVHEAYFARYGGIGNLSPVSHIRIYV